MNAFKPRHNDQLHHAMLPREIKAVVLSDVDRTNRALWGIYQVVKRTERQLIFVLERLEELSFPSQETVIPGRAETHRKLPARPPGPPTVTKSNGPDSDRVHALRKRLDLTQADLAARLGISRVMIVHLEGGRSDISPRLNAKMERLERQ